MGVDAQMFVRTKQPVSKSQVDEWAYFLYGVFRDYLSIWHDNAYGIEPRHCMSIINIYQQDGPDIIPEEGETFIEVHLSGRYYGKGYERGPFYIYKSIAEWLENVIPGAEVWYGGDSSGCEAIKFDREAREKIFQHYCKVGHLPYQAFFNRNENPVVCTFCHKPMVHCGGGSSHSFWFCYGCKEQAISQKGQVALRWHDGKDFFEKSKELDEASKEEPK